ncbi:MAG: DUF4968 domain-containing protein, partial [candidate division KSB1 bacterium]|nr:DUF4968 domain-containing protein [candidate division KSB1 bacterium]
MKQFHILLILLFLSFSLFAQEYNPVADPKAMVISGQTRFTVLTPRVIRLEWAEDGKFEDQASLVFVNRKLPVPEFNQKVKQGWLTIATSDLILKYKIGSGKFTDQNLQIEFTVDGMKKVWTPG